MAPLPQKSSNMSNIVKTIIIQNMVPTKAILNLMAQVNLVQSMVQLKWLLSLPLIMLTKMKKRSIYNLNLRLVRLYLKEQ